MHGRGGLWAVVLVVLIVAAAGPGSGQGRTLRGPASSNEDAVRLQNLQYEQHHAAPARLLSAAGAGPSNTAAAAPDVKARLDPGHSNFLSSENAKLFAMSRCRYRFCNPEPSAAVPKK
jgi:hypothetical protein